MAKTVSVKGEIRQKTKRITILPHVIIIIHSPCGSMGNYAATARREESAWLLESGDFLWWPHIHVHFQIWGYVQEMRRKVRKASAVVRVWRTDATTHAAV